MMKPNTSTDGKRKLAGLIQVESLATPAPRGKPLATSLVLRTKANARRQSAAIAKLVKMCKTSPVVANASRGITAEVRRDRDRGHE